MLPELPNPANEPELDFPAPPQSPPREPFWSYIDLLLFIGLALAATVAVTVIAAGFVHTWPKLESNSGVLLLSLQLALYGLFYACFWAVFRTRYNRPVFRSLGWRHSAFPPALAVIVGPALAFFVSIVASKLNTPNIKTPFDTMVNSQLTFTLLAVTAVVAAPIFEELFFRGFLQPLLCRTFGIIAGVLVTAALFGAAHGAEYKWTWQYIFAVGIVGAVFGWVRARTGSVIPSTIMHGCYNAVFVGALYFSKHGRFS
jgi:membrane protease YdiL (CAAX protease family)